MVDVGVVLGVSEEKDKAEVVSPTHSPTRPRPRLASGGCAGGGEIVRIAGVEIAEVDIAEVEIAEVEIAEVDTYAEGDAGPNGKPAVLRILEILAAETAEAQVGTVPDTQAEAEAEAQRIREIPLLVDLDSVPDLELEPGCLTKKPPQPMSEYTSNHTGIDHPANPQHYQLLPLLPNSSIHDQQTWTQRSPR